MTADTSPLSENKQPSAGRLILFLFALCACVLIVMAVKVERQVSAGQAAITAEARACEESGGTVLYLDQGGKHPMFARDGSVACMRN